MRSVLNISWLLLSAVLPGVAQDAAEHSSPAQRVQLTLDLSEARQALAILHKEQAHEAVTDADWQALFATAPYQWLKQRETSMHRDFTEDDFKKFLASPEAIAKTAEWETALIRLQQADMTALGERDLAWLPDGAVIHARVFPEIKPRNNSFVWQNTQGEAGIFLYLEKQPPGQFENIVAHECHHIGLRSLGAIHDKLTDGKSPQFKSAMEWLTAFGEGEAMLAAAGSTHVHPRDETAVARARWDSDMMHFNADVATLAQFFNDVLDGKLTGDAMSQKAYSFFGYHGPWYSVGYEMAALVEQRFGREVFLQCLVDPRQLLVRYNEIAKESNEAPDGASLAL
jgi:Putative zinc dependent peptidase (DUF5700)